MASTDEASGDAYEGRYGQSLSMGLVNLGMEWGVGRDGVLTYGESGENRAKFTIEFVRTTPTTNTNAQYSRRQSGTVYLRDVFRLKLEGTDRYVRFEPSDRTFRVGGSGAPAEFLLINKYGGKIDTVDTDRYCKGVYDSFEYYEDVNNRNVSCEFPYTDCYGRCAMRKLFLVQGSKRSTVGLNWRDRQKRVTIDSVSGWRYYEHVVY